MPEFTKPITASILKELKDLSKTKPKVFRLGPDEYAILSYLAGPSRQEDVLCHIYGVPVLRDGGLSGYEVE